MVVPRTVRAWVLPEPARVELEERALPAVGTTDVLLAVEEVGMCSSEVERFRGNAPHKPRERIGHEVAGRVVEVGSAVTSLRTGDRVAVQADGGFAEKMVVPAAWCVRVPAGIRHPSIVEPAGCMVASAERVGQALGASVVVVGGTGPMGELMVRVARLKTPGLLVVSGRRMDRLVDATNEAGALVVNTAIGGVNLVAAVKHLTNGEGADVVYDCGGNEETLRLAVAVTKPTGVLGLVGFPQSDMTVPMGDIIRKRVKLELCHFTLEQLLPGMRAAVHLLAAGHLDDAALVSHVFAFDDLQRAFETAVSRPEGSRRLVVRVGE
jgi:threonine dehydrogenase-like Zn-dependent dehydrogenase